ncbi:MAG: Hpt domain-containing protein [Chitinophagales bacterium]
MKTIQISRPILQSLYGDCTESMAEVFSQFLSSHSEISENLVSSYNSEDLELLKKFLHFHGPSFMYLGMPLVSDCFKNLEEQCKRGSDRSSISSEFNILMHFVDQSKQLIANELASLKKAA